MHKNAVCQIIILCCIILIITCPKRTFAFSDSVVTDTLIEVNDSANQDTLSQILNTDTVMSEVGYFKSDYQLRNNPKRAGMFSAIIPGGGQIYNRQYWKVPIVYAALGTGIGFTVHKLGKYNDFRKELAVRQSTRGVRNPELAFLNDAQIQRGMDEYKQELDLSVLLTAVGYFLQIMDAIAANHLKGFDISPDISMKINATPVNNFSNQSMGIGIAFQLK